jgi:hypothetical protein
MVLSSISLQCVQHYGLVAASGDCSALINCFGEVSEGGGMKLFDLDELNKQAAVQVG